MPEPERRFDEPTLFGLVSLLGIVAASHAVLADFDFVYADRLALVYDGFGSRAADLLALVTGDAVAAGVPDAWHPLAVLTRFVDRALFGLAPGGYYVHNVAWHGTVVVVTAGWVRAALASDRLAWCVGALLAIWPAHAITVCTLEHRGVLIASAAIGAALWCLVRQRAAAAAACVLAGMLAHEIAMLSLLIWPWLCWLRQPESSLPQLWRRCRGELGWLGGGVAVSLLLRAWWLPALAWPETTSRGALGSAAAAGVTFVTELGQLLVPVGLGRIHPDAPSGWPPPVTAGVGVLLLIALGVAWRRGADRVLLAGVLLAVIGLLPVTVLWPLGGSWHDPFLYVPSVGIALTGARALVRYAWPSRWRWGAVGLVAAVLVVWHHRVEARLEDEGVQWADARRTAPDNVETWRGSVAWAIGVNRLDAARDFRRTALRSFPDDPVLLAAEAAMDCGAQGAAESLAQFAAVPLAEHPRPAHVHLQRAGCALRVGELREAIDAASEAHRLSPWMPDPLAVRGEAHARIGNDAAAEQDLLAACRVHPSRHDLWRQLADHYDRRRLHDRANEIRRSFGDTGARAR